MSHLLKSFSVHDYPSAITALIAATIVISAGVVDVLLQPNELTVIKNKKSDFLRCLLMPDAKNSNQPQIAFLWISNTLELARRNSYRP